MDRVMGVIGGLLIGGGIGAVLAFIAIFSNLSNPVAALGWSIFFLGAGWVTGVVIGLRRTRDAPSGASRLERHVARRRTDPYAEENWGDVDYWSMVYRNVDSRLSAVSVRRDGPRTATVSGTFDSAWVELKHETYAHDGEHVLVTSWPTVTDDALVRRLSAAWWSQTWW